MKYIAVKFYAKPVGLASYAEKKAWKTRTKKVGGHTWPLVFAASLLVPVFQSTVSGMLVEMYCTAGHP